LNFPAPQCKFVNVLLFLQYLSEACHRANQAARAQHKESELRFSDVQQGTAKSLILAASFSSALLASASAPAAQPACAVPAFTPMASAKVGETPAGVSMQVASMFSVAVPAGAKSMVFSSNANLMVFPDRRRLTIALETAQTMASYQEGAQPEPFFRDLFTGRTAAGCKHLQALRLEQEDYRLQSKLGTLSIFAHGKHRGHEAYILDSAKPHTVVRIRLSGVERSAFESLLATIKPQ
jgi:hypothetical protein